MRLYTRIVAPLAGALALLFAAGGAMAETEIDVEKALAERSIGAEDAPVTIVEHFSLTCPHCASFHDETFPALKEKYVDTGKVKFVFSDFPLDREAFRAAILARCAEPERYPGLVDVLLESQRSWASAPDPGQALMRIGQLAGVSPERFEACLASDPLITGMLERRKAASEAGVNSTPSFFVNGRLYPGGRSIEEFSAIIDPLLADK